MDNDVVDTQIEADIFAIQNNALTAGGANRVVRTLTRKQALSIYMRSNQLARESESHPIINQYELRRQTNICYEQRRNQVE